MTRRPIACPLACMITDGETAELIRRENRRQGITFVLRTRYSIPGGQHKGSSLYCSQTLLHSLSSNRDNLQEYGVVVVAIVVTVAIRAPSRNETLEHSESPG